jgi:hypothetical protein
MAILKRCAVCDELMTVRPALVNRKKYCSKACARIGWRGAHRSTATEFKPGNRPQTWVPVGTESAATKVGYIKVKVADPNVWRLRSHLVWEAHHGKPLPEGWIIRRRDGDPTNDDISNLEAMPRGKHLLRTLEDPVIERRARRRSARAARKRHKRNREAQFDAYYWG